MTEPMPDRRTARGTRLLDPVWHQMQAAVQKLYAEIEPGARAGALNLVVDNADGLVVSYVVQFDRSDEVERFIITDEQRLVDTWGESMIDAPAVQQHSDWALDVRHQGGQAVSAAVRLLVEAAPQLALDRDWLLEHIEQLQAAHELMATQFRTMQQEKEHGWREAEMHERRADIHLDARSKLELHRQAALNEVSAALVTPAGDAARFALLAIRKALGADDDQ